MSSDRARAITRITGRVAASAALLGLFVTSAGAAEIQVELNHSKALHLTAPVATVMVGNPSIADVSVQGSQLLYVLARSYGKTDLIALDSSGKQIAQFEVDVVAPKTSAVTLTRGAAQVTYNCTPRCEPVVNPSDDGEAFKTAIGQSNAVRATGSGAASSASDQRE